MKIQNLNIPESKVLQFDTVKAYFNDLTNVLKVSDNGEIDFTIIKNIIDKASVKPNIYGILVKDKSSKIWELKYIGQRKSKDIKARLRQHLIKKDYRTGAQLDKVTKCLNDNMDIGIKLFAIEPDELRQYYEEKLLKSITNLSWNKQS